MVTCHKVYLICIRSLGGRDYIAAHDPTAALIDGVMCTNTEANHGGKLSMIGVQQQQQSRSNNH